MLVFGDFLQKGLWKLQFGHKMTIFASNLDRGPLKAFWQLHFCCKMAILAPNLYLRLLKPSGNYNLGVKWQFSGPLVPADLVSWRASSDCVLFCRGCDEDPGRGVRPTRGANRTFCWQVLAGHVPIAWSVRLPVVSRIYASLHPCHRRT